MDITPGFGLHDIDSKISDILFSSIGDGAIVTDERARIFKVNNSALKILGFKEKDLLNKWFPETIVAETEDGTPLPKLERPITEVFITGKPVNRRLHYLKKDGERIAVAINISPIINRGKPVGAIEIFRDISDELQLERAKDEFISIASHQLRTPATTVKQYIGMILEGYASSPDQEKKMLETAYEHNNKQLEIITELLQIAQAEANTLTVNFQYTDMVSLINNVIDGQKNNYKQAGIELHFIPQKDSLMCNVDRLHMQMVFDNILHNAQKYSYKDTTVEVRAKQSGSNIIVSIQDQGIGISEEYLPKLFQKFSRADNVVSTASGTGLGLYWAKKLVDLHGGKIKVKSEFEKGSTFTIILKGDPDK